MRAFIEGVLAGLLFVALGFLIAQCVQAYVLLAACTA